MLIIIIIIIVIIINITNISSNTKKFFSSFEFKINPPLLLIVFIIIKLIFLSYEIQILWLVTTQMFYVHRNLRYFAPICHGFDGEIRLHESGVWLLPT